MDGSLLAPLMNSSKDNLPAESRGGEEKQGSASAAAVTGDDGLSHAADRHELKHACPRMEQVFFYFLFFFFKKEKRKKDHELVVIKKKGQVLQPVGDAVGQLFLT